MRQPKFRGVAATAGILALCCAGCANDREPGSASVPAAAQASTSESTPASALDELQTAARPDSGASDPTASLSDDAQGVRVPVEERSTPQGFASEAGTAARSSFRTLSPATVPLAPMGVEPGASVLDGVESPDRVKDEEIDAVRRGKRLVGPIEEELGGGFSSAEDLARAVLDATHANDSQTLHALRVSNREFARIFWPEFPQSRPATNVQATDAWFFHDASCHDGVSETVSSYGGRDLELLEVRCIKGRLDYTNFDLYDGIEIEAVDASGERVTIPWATTFAERNGAWKVFLYKS